MVDRYTCEKCLSSSAWLRSFNTTAHARSGERAHIHVPNCLCQQKYIYGFHSVSKSAPFVGTRTLTHMLIPTKSNIRKYVRTFVSITGQRERTFNKISEIFTYKFKTVICHIRKLFIIYSLCMLQCDNIDVTNVRSKL